MARQPLVVGNEMEQPLPDAVFFAARVLLPGHLPELLCWEHGEVEPEGECEELEGVRVRVVLICGACGIG